MASSSSPPNDEGATTATTTTGMRSRHPVNLAIDISLANATNVKKALVTNRAHPPTHNNNTTTNGNSSSQYKNNPLTPPGYRGHADLRSPGAARTPMNATATASTSVWNFDTVDADDNNEVEVGGENNKGEGVRGEYAVALSAGGTSNTNSTSANNNNSNVAVEEPLSPLADFITQTDRHGNASTPRSAESITAARKLHPSGPKPILHVDAKTGSLVETKSETKDTLDDDDEEEEEDDHSEDALLKDNEGDVTTTTIHTSYDDPALMAAGATSAGGAAADGVGGEDACDTLLDSFRMMCCCLLPDDGGGANNINADGQNNGNGNNGAPNGGKARGMGDYSSTTTDKVGVRRGSTSKQPSTNSNNSSSTTTTTASHPIGYSTRGHDAPLLLEQDSALCNNPNNIKLLPELHVEDVGKKCLVLDLDETLVHSSFRAVAGADFVIPVQIEDVIHYVYVAKRPGVENFLLEMSKHYEIVVYTASLNKYADVLLDLLDPHRVIRTRLFRESCVFYEGNYVKDLCLLNRDLSQVIIIDNSPASYMFHPENAIDCSSFIDDVNDRELDQIGQFLKGVAMEKSVVDVRGMVTLWRHWPNVDLTKNHYRRI
ncbi:hypothetical protein ACHAWU_007339 [Discostella pseudostelligera]|uniref:protein-serine/threonine phosphatase n=1 Tax=Discostella pseudostelligera TaxID=259834 RepID=A0ABD3M8W8_9STRA